MKRPNLTPSSMPIMRIRSYGSVKRYASSEYKAIFETVLVGTFALVLLLAILLFISYWALHNTYVLGRIFICGGALLYLAITYRAWTKQRHLIASQLLIFFYYLIATLVMFGWGVDTTFSQLMLAITIVLAGIFIGANGVFITAGAAIIGMLIVQAAVSAHLAPWFNPSDHTSLGDVIGFGSLLTVLALITGFFDKRTQELHTEELNLNQELTKEKSTLERRVRSHTKEIEHLQLEQAEQLYRFAEIGQLSTLLLHDLSNHLTVLNIDLADLKREKGTTPAHIEESINHLEDSVKQASRHLQGKEQMHEFDVLKCIESSTKLPHYQDLKECISISAPPHRVHLYGDPLRLSHILFILIRNALESYPRNTPSRERTVTIELETNEDTISISVTDQGRGVPEAIRDQLFSPMISTKKGGLGIGLFIAKEITESYFGGMLQLGDVTKGTKFILTIPKQPTRHGAE